MQVTALGNPKLLERVSNGVLTLQALFKQFDTDNNNVVSREEFGQVNSGTYSIEALQQHMRSRMASPYRPFQRPKCRGKRYCITSNHLKDVRKKCTP